MICFELDGAPVEVVGDDMSLLDALREHLGCRTVKDGCSPQGQCGCCTVLIDGSPRVACVTPLRRVAGRSVTTVDGIEPATAQRWADAFVAAGASQCGFCTPGIVLRLAALSRRRPDADEAAVRTALLAHLCRCTGWQSIVEAARSVLADELPALPTDPAAALNPAPAPPPAASPRDPLLTAWRAQIEGPAFQHSGVEVVLGSAGFADDIAPAGATVALAGSSAGRDTGHRAHYALAPSVDLARQLANNVQGRNSTVALRHPLEVPDGEWLLTLQTTFVEPAYLEPDASWCIPGGRPASPLANGGAFGGKRHSAAPSDARRLADEQGATVRVLWPREEVVRRGPKRPPLAVGIAGDGTGVLRLGHSAGSELPDVVERIAAVAPGLVVEPTLVAGPPLSSDLRGAGWAEALAVVAVARLLVDGQADPGAPVSVETPAGGRATVSVAADGTVEVEVWAGELLDEVTLRSYCMGAVHQALGLVWQEGIAVDESGEIHDLTIRSFGILDARETPPMHFTLHQSARWPVNGSDAVFAATMAAAWMTEGLPSQWPTRRSAVPASTGGRS